MSDNIRQDVLWKIEQKFHNCFDVTASECEDCAKLAEEIIDMVQTHYWKLNH